MKQLSAALEADLASRVSSAFFVASVEFDDGVRHFAERAGTVGGDILVAAVDGWGQITSTIASFDVPRAAVPAGAFPWVRRRAVIREVLPGAYGVSAGAIVFDGIVSEEPAERGGLLSVRLGLRRVLQATVPSGLPISSSEFPLAPASTVGKLKPEIWGRVDACELLPIEQQPWSRLAETAPLGATQLELGDAREFSAQGVVSIDGESYVYTARTDRTLLGLSLRRPHAAGAVVSQSGRWRFLAAGHAVSAIADLAANSVLVDATDASIDLAGATVTLPGPPLVRAASQPYNVALQFDRVSSSGAATYTVDYGIVGQDSGDEPIWANLSTFVIPPQNVTAGTYSFTVTWAAQPNPSLANPSTYTAYLGGVAVTLDAAGGSRSVSVPVTTNAPLVLTHNVNGGSNQATPRIVSVGVTWTQAANPTPALNPLNAIMGATGTQTQGATILPGPVTAAAVGVITFARPSQDRIIAGVYAVAFTVAGASAGVERVQIGNDVVWVSDGGVVVYNYTLAALQFDDDTDTLPITVTGTATVTITSASRTVTTGNLDQANYATLRWPSNTILRADQTTANPNRGPITRARLVVEWFSTSALSGSVAVRFGGVQVGTLIQQAVAGETITRTVDVDIVSQGAATLTNGTNIAVSVSGGTASLSSTVSVVRQTYSVAYVQHPTVTGFWYARLRIVPPQNVLAGVHTAVLQTQPTGSGSITVGIYDDLSGGFGGPVGRSPSITPNATVSSGFFLAAANSTIPVGFAHDVLSASEPRVASISVDWNVAPTAVTSVPASGSSTVPNPNLPNSGIAASGGDITFTLPAPPRATVTAFDLPTYRDWSKFTNKMVELEYLSGSAAADVGIVQVQILVDYEQVDYAVAGAADVPLTATVTGRSGNPGDVLRDLAIRRGLAVAGTPYRRLSDWSLAVGFSLSRRLDEAVDAAELMNAAAQSALVQIHETEGGLAFVRRLDLGTNHIVVRETDLLDGDPSIEWSAAEACANELVLLYRMIGGSPTKAITANSESGPAAARVWANRGQREIGGRQRIELTLPWLSDDTAAQLFQRDWLRLNAPLRRTLTLALPYAFGATEGGDILFYEPHGALYRVTQVVRDAAGGVTLTAEEIPE